MEAEVRCPICGFENIFDQDDEEIKCECCGENLIIEEDETGFFAILC